MDLPWLVNACQQCALPLQRDESFPENPHDDEQAICGECLRREPSFDRCFAPFLYHAPISKMILQFKNYQDLTRGKILGDLLIESLTHQPYFELPELIVPTPLHWRRQLFRGLNQAAFLAERISLALQLPLAHAITRIQNTPKQQHLSRRERIKSYRKVFHCDEKLVRGKTVALVDDVVTTGATIEAMSACLKKAGATRVLAWTIARTPATHLTKLSK